MGMSYQSPLGKLPVKRKKNIKDPPIKLPEVIKLPDGRIVPLSEILKKAKDKEFINLKTKKTSARASSIVKDPKYTLQDHMWIVQATPEEVQERYQLRDAYVRTFINRSKTILERLNSGTEDHVIIVGQALSDT